MYESNPYLKQMGCSHDRRKERELYEKPTKEKLENIEYFKQEGNKAMKLNEFDKASYFYQKAIVTLDYTFGDNEEEEKCADRLKELVLQNMSICKFSQKKFDDSLNFARLCLQVNKENVKAKYKRAQIYLNRDLFDKCEEEAKQILELDEKNQSSLQILIDLAEKKKQYKESNKQVYGNMFSGQDKETSEKNSDAEKKNE